MPNEVIQNGRPQLAITTSQAQIQAIAAAEEVKCLFLASMQSPRDTIQCKQEIINLCTDKVLAEDALYAYRRGGQLIEGASIDLIDEIATIWGRISSGWTVVDSTPTASQVTAFAIDFQSLKKDSRTFWVEHKSAKGQPITDARDIYEMIANQAQRRKRSCIESVIPAHVIAAAVNQVKETLKAADTRPMSKRIEELVKYFWDSHGINKAQLEKKIGSKIDAITDTQIVSLRAIAKSLRDGAPVEDYFDMSLKAAPQAGTESKGNPPAEADAAKGKSRGKQKSASDGTQQSLSSTNESTSVVASDLDSSSTQDQSSSANVQQDANATTEPPELDLTGLDFK